MGETPDISNTEEVSMCLCYIFSGFTKEFFIEFFVTYSKDSESLYKLDEEVFIKYEIDIKYLIANSFDRAANMSGKNKGLSTRLKMCPPLSIYIHC